MCIKAALLVILHYRLVGNRYPFSCHTQIRWLHLGSKYYVQCFATKLETEAVLTQLRLVSMNNPSVSVILIF